MVDELVGNMEEEAISDKFIMPFGKYKGEYLGDIPSAYLLWLSDESENPPEFAVRYVNSKRFELEKENDTYYTRG